MIPTTASWWRARSAREQRLLLVMFALIALLVAWLLVIRPLADALDSAQRRHSAAVVALAEARTRADLARRLDAERPATVALPVDALIARRATEAGFTGARITGQGPARAAVAIDSARPQALFGWVAQLERQGLAVESLRARANPDRTLAAEAVLRARGR